MRISSPRSVHTELRRAGATSPVIVRADSEFWNYRLVEELDDMGLSWSLSLSQYLAGQRGNRAHHRVTSGNPSMLLRVWRGAPGGDLLCRLHEEGKGSSTTESKACAAHGLKNPTQAGPWPDWRYHAFSTSTELSPAEAVRLPPGQSPSVLGHLWMSMPTGASLALPVWELLRQCRLAGLHGTCSLPLHHGQLFAPARSHN